MLTGSMWLLPYFEQWHKCQCLFYNHALNILKTFNLRHFSPYLNRLFVSDHLYACFFPSDKSYKLHSRKLSFCSNYEYYPLEDLNGKLRIYKTLSDYLQKKTELTVFINDYNDILFEELDETISEIRHHLI